jgi:hypothetical protein
MSTQPTTGRCLCGAVTVAVSGLGDEISACFCDLCRRWGGGLQMGIEAPADRVRIDGPVKVHRSSKLAERAWCDTCGSALFFRYVSGRETGYLELSPGLFENAGGARLTRVVYADRAPDGLRLGGDHLSLSQAEYEAAFDHLNEGDAP